MLFLVFLTRVRVYIIMTFCRTYTNIFIYVVCITGNYSTVLNLNLVFHIFKKILHAQNTLFSPGYCSKRLAFSSCSLWQKTGFFLLFIVAKDWLFPLLHCGKRLDFYRENIFNVSLIQIDQKLKIVFFLLLSKWFLGDIKVPIFSVSYMNPYDIGYWMGRNIRNTVQQR